MLGAKMPRNRAAKVSRVELNPTLETLVAQISSENRHPEVYWGPPIGKEKDGWDVTSPPRTRRRPQSTKQP